MTFESRFITKYFDYNIKIQLIIVYYILVEFSVAKLKYTQNASTSVNKLVNKSFFKRQ